MMSKSSITTVDQFNVKSVRLYERENCGLTCVFNKEPAQKKCCTDNWKSVCRRKLWPYMEVFCSPLIEDKILMKNLQVRDKISVWVVNNSFVRQILIEKLLENGVTISPLIWECIANYTILQTQQRHKVNGSHNKDKSTIIETFNYAYLDYKKCKSICERDFPNCFKIRSVVEALTELRVIENTTKNKEIGNLTTSKNIDENVFERNMEKWYNNVFFFPKNINLLTITTFPVVGNVSLSFDKILQGTPSDDFEIMKFEFHRLSSFSKYNFTDVPSFIKMAKEGWFATGKEKETKTFCCSVVFPNWRRNDDPFYIHKMLSPTCPFLLGEDIGQVPFHEDNTDSKYDQNTDNARCKDGHQGCQIEHSGKTPQEEVIYQRTDCTGSIIDENVQEKVHTNTGFCNKDTNERDIKSVPQNYDNENCVIKNSLNLNWKISDARYPHQSELESRIESFSVINKFDYALRTGLGSENYVIANKTAEEFARAGLFYRGFRDRTSCFYCGIGLQDWTSLDNIIQRHYQSSENCPIAQTSLHQFNSERSISTAFQNQSNERAINERIDAELEEMGFTQELIKAAVESLRHKGVSCNKERIVNEILDNRPALIQSLPSIPEGAQYNSSNFHEEEALEYPSMETTNGENAEKTISPNEMKERTASTSNFKEQSDDELRLRVTCKVCLSEEVGVLFLPCSHLVSCISCSRRLKKCPLCRKHIQTKQPMYW